MQDIYEQLADAISDAMLDRPHDPNSTLPERFKVGRLVEYARAYGLGDLDREDLVLAFNGSGFDVVQWLEDMETEGHFVP